MAGNGRREDPELSATRPAPELKARRVLCQACRFSASDERLEVRSMGSLAARNALIGARGGTRGLGELIGTRASKGDPSAGRTNRHDARVVGAAFWWPPGRRICSCSLVGLGAGSRALFGDRRGLWHPTPRLLHPYRCLFGFRAKATSLPRADPRLAASIALLRLMSWPRLSRSI